MSFGHRGFSQLHNPKKRRKDGGPLGGAQGTIEVHFTDGVPHPTTSQAKEVPFQLGNWRGKVDLLVSALGGMDCVLGMEFNTQNNVLIERHNRLVRIPSKSGIVKVKAHEMPCVGGPTIHLMLGKTWKENAWEVTACCVSCGCWMSMSPRKPPSW